MKYSKISFITILVCLSTQLIRMNIDINRKLSSAIVWLIQYPLLVMSILCAIIVLLNVGKKAKLKDILLIVPTVSWAIYFICIILFTFFK